MPESCAAIEISQAVSIDIDAVLEVEEQPVEAGRLHHLDDVDVAHQPDADADRQLVLLEPRLGGVDCDGHVSSSGFRRFALGKLDAMTFHVERIDHVVLRVRDQPAMVRFYEQALGFKVERRLDRISLVQTARRRLAARSGPRRARRGCAATWITSASA